MKLFIKMRQPDSCASASGRHRGSHMNQKGKRLLQVLIVIALACTQSGCGTQDSRQREDLAFTVCADTELPDDLRRVIDEKKQQAFQVSYTTQDALYIAVGYGAHDRMNLQVIVEELYRTDRAIYVKTNLVTEEASSTDGAAGNVTDEAADGAAGNTASSATGSASMYPYIVIRTEKISLPVLNVS